MAPVSLPVAVAGFTTCWLIDQFRLFGYGAELPSDVRAVLQMHHEERASRALPRDRQVLLVQAAVALILVLSLAFHVAEVGLARLPLGPVYNWGPLARFRAGWRRTRVRVVAALSKKVFGGD